MKTLDNHVEFRFRYSFVEEVLDHLSLLRNNVFLLSEKCSSSLDVEEQGIIINFISINKNRKKWKIILMTEW